MWKLPPNLNGSDWNSDEDHIIFAGRIARKTVKVIVMDLADAGFKRSEHSIRARLHTWKKHSIYVEEMDQFIADPSFYDYKEGKFKSDDEFKAAADAVYKKALAEYKKSNKRKIKKAG